MFYVEHEELLFCLKDKNMEIMKKKLKSLSVGILSVVGVLGVAERDLYAQNAGAQWQSNSFSYLTDVLTTSEPTSSVSSTWNSAWPPKHFVLSVTTQATGFLVALEGSLDNSNWYQIAQTDTARGVALNGTPMSAIYLRLKARVIGANSAVTATAIGVR